MTISDARRGRHGCGKEVRTHGREPHTTYHQNAYLRFEHMLASVLITMVTNGAVAEGQELMIGLGGKRRSATKLCQCVHCTPHPLRGKAPTVCRR